MKIKEEIKPKVEEFILDFTNHYSKRNVNDQQQFLNYVFKVIENENESDEIDESFCASQLEDFFGNKSSKFVSELIQLIRQDEKPEVSRERDESPPVDHEEEEKEPMNEILAKSELSSQHSPEESEGKNIFKYNRDSSDEEESDDEGRNHKRRKSSGQESPEKENKDEKEVKKPMNPQKPGEPPHGMMHPRGNFKKGQMPGFPYQNPFMAPNAMNPMFKKKFMGGGVLNKKMMMPPFNPMFFPPHLHPMGLPPEYFFPPPNYPWTPNPQDKVNPPPINEYDPLNPGNTLLQPANPASSLPFYDPSKSLPKLPNFPRGPPKFNPPLQSMNKLPGENGMDSSKIERKENEDNNATPMKGHEGGMNFKDSDEKGRKTNKSPKKSEKKPIRDTVYIKNIPNYYNSVETLSKFYKKFGSIENIQVEQSKNLATVKFMKALDAVKAVNCNKKLFGKEEIFVTLNPEEEPPKKAVNTGKDASGKEPGVNPTNNQSTAAGMHPSKVIKKPAKPENSLLAPKFSKFQELKTKKEKEALKDMIKKKLANKLKFLLFLKNRIEKPELKSELLAEINKIKSHKEEIEKGVFDEGIKELFEKENMDPSFDYTLILSNLPENLMNYAGLQAKLEAYGKIESLKIMKKDGKAHVRFLSFDAAEKAYLTEHELIFEFTDRKLLNFLKKEGKAVEDVASHPMEEERKEAGEMQTEAPEAEIQT